MNPLQLKQLYHITRSLQTKDKLWQFSFVMEVDIFTKLMEKSSMPNLLSRTKLSRFITIANYSLSKGARQIKNVSKLLLGCKYFKFSKIYILTLQRVYICQLNTKMTHYFGFCFGQQIFFS